MDNMSPEKHISRIPGNAYELLRNIKVAFTYIDEDVIEKLIMTQIHLKLEFATRVWSLNNNNLGKTRKNAEDNNKASSKFK